MMARNNLPPRPLIVGIAGPVLGVEEHHLLRRVNPAGIILFRRNIVDPAQVRALTNNIAETLCTGNPIVLTDQEGGRVRRLSAPPWPAFPAAGRLTNHPEGIVQAARIQGQLMGQALMRLGISVNCAPVLDVRGPDSNDTVMGDRCFGTQPDIVCAGGQGLFAGQCDAGLVSVMKHMPGHGRARVDSHYDLPVIDTPLAVLDECDFMPFRHFAALNDARLWGMTAHILAPEIDPVLPATLSKPIIERIIRGQIGFGGILLSDDIEMGALTGTLEARINQSLAAGCDVILHCSGKLGALLPAIELLGPMPEHRWLMMQDSLAAARAGAEPLLSLKSYQENLDRLIGTTQIVGAHIDPTLYQPVV